MKEKPKLIEYLKEIEIFKELKEENLNKISGFFSMKTFLWGNQ